MYKNLVYKFVLLVFFVNHFTIQAQSNNQLWQRTILSLKDSLGITYELEFQHRLQTIGTENIPKYPFLNSGRIWMQYSINEKMKISLSPMAFFNHIKYKNKDEVYLKSHITEYRNSLAADYQFMQQKTFHLYARTAIEFRFLSNKKNEFRWRNRVGVDIKISDKTTVKPFYEIFYKNSTANSLIVDQMRFNLSIKQLISKKWIVEFGGIEQLNSNEQLQKLEKKANAFLNIQYNL